MYDNATDQAEALGPHRELTEAVISLSEARGVTRNDGRFLLAEIRTLHDDYPRWNRRVSVYLHPAEGAFEVVGIDRETDLPSLGMGVGGRN